MITRSVTNAMSEMKLTAKPKTVTRAERGRERERERERAKELVAVSGMSIHGRGRP